MFLEAVEGLDRMGRGNCQRGFTGGIVRSPEKLAHPRDRPHAFNAQNAAVTGAEDFRLIIPENCSRAQQQGSGWRTDLRHCSQDFNPHSLVFICEQIDQVRKQIYLPENSTLYECKGAGSPECSGSVRAPSVDGFELDVPQPPEKRLGFLVFECRKGTAECVFRPALRICLFSVFEKAVERGQEFRSQLLHVRLANQVGGFGYNEVISVCDRAA